MAIQSYDVVAGDDILAVDHNYLRADLLTNDITMAGVKTFSDIPKFSVGIKIPVNIKILLDDGASANDTYIIGHPGGLSDTVDFYAGGNRCLRLTDNGGVALHQGKQLFLDGGSDSYIIGEPAGLSDTIDFYVNGSRSLRLTDDNGMAITATKKLYLDSGANTYLTESSGDTVDIVTNGSTRLRVDTVDIIAYSNIKIGNALKVGAGAITFGAYFAASHNIAANSADDMVFTLGGKQFLWGNAAGLSPVGSAAADLGSSTSNDWNVIYYHTLSQHCSRQDKEQIREVDNETLKAKAIPSPKIYKRKNKTNAPDEYGLIAEECPADVVEKDKDGVPMIQTNSLIAYLCGVIKKLDERLDALEGKQNA